jgi:uncharacterized membrane protein YhfC
MIEISIRVVSAVLMMALPVLLFVVLRRTNVATWRYIRIGASAFIASQVFHVPFNMVVLPALIKSFRLDSLQDANGMNLVILAAFLGLSAGFFEEVARYLVYRYWLTATDYTWKNAVTLGAGHGGCEAIILGVFALVSLAQMIVLRTADLSKILPPDKIEQAQEQIQWYWSLSWYQVLMQPVERVIAMTFHVSASVLVLQVFLQDNLMWLVAAIVFHAALDVLAVVVMVRKWNMVLVEAVLAVLVVPVAFTIISHFKPATATFRSIPQDDEQEEGHIDVDKDNDSTKPRSQHENDCS